ncbi:MAG: hypothetical protein WCH35_06340 [Comamonadaceae bacterium]
MFEKLKEGAAGAVANKAHEVLQEFNNTLPTLKALGLSVSNISFGMGLVPEIKATFTGSVEALEPDKIKDLMEQHRDKKTLIAILEVLRTAGTFKEQLSELPVTGIKVDVTLGIPPKLAVELLTKNTTRDLSA